ncbi:hypothetical protein AJ79_06874 [Helicocarpus griseus UAMH5409]|uniref:Xylanolytic transcriptional activator regulatory domain-containing protein n=1 Tax=Helicocarpus griseus UAMH5409 TaxID=1447875 RepID=A0A2B7X7T4_9EURO|nr:hypothetical protein AJ79_06874 [Helicocarpus griseus UAMH5409]
MDRKRPAPPPSSLPEKSANDRPRKQPRMSLSTILNDADGSQDASLPSLRREPLRRPRASPSFQLVGAVSERQSQVNESDEGDDEDSSSDDDEKEKPKRLKRTHSFTPQGRNKRTRAQESSHSESTEESPRRDDEKAERSRGSRSSEKNARSSQISVRESSGYERAASSSRQDEEQSAVLKTSLLFGPQARKVRPEAQESSAHSRIDKSSVQHDRRSENTSGFRPFLQQIQNVGGVARVQESSGSESVEESPEMKRGRLRGSRDSRSSVRSSVPRSENLPVGSRASQSSRKTEESQESEDSEASEESHEPGVSQESQKFQETREARVSQEIQKHRQSEELEESTDSDEAESEPSEEEKAAEGQEVEHHAKDEESGEEEEGKEEDEEDESISDVDEDMEEPDVHQPYVSPTPDSPIESREPSDSERSVEMDEAEESSDTSESEMEDDDINFLAGITQAVLERTGVSKSGATVCSNREQKRLGNVVNRKSKWPELSPPLEELELPRRDECDKYVSRYLTREYVALPIFLRESFEKTYEKVMDTPTELSDDLVLFRGILNAIFALTSLLIDPTDRDNAEKLFSRAQKLIFLNGIRGSSIEYTQAYLLLTQYYITTSYFPAAWKTIGLAIRTAQSLRLNLSSGSHHRISRDDQELAKRVWHCSLLLERITAMNMGITVVTERSHEIFEPPFPMAGDGDYIDLFDIVASSSKAPRPSFDRPSIIEFFNSCARLYDFYSKTAPIQEELRLTTSASTSALKKLKVFDPQQLLAIDRSLSIWQEGLPPFLNPDTDIEKINQAIPRRLHNMLRLRCLHMRLLLWRPLLAIVAAASPDINTRPRLDITQNIQRRLAIDKFEMPMIHAIAHESAIKCILIASEMTQILGSVENIGGRGRRHDDVLPVPALWENVGYVFACAKVFIAARRCPKGVFEAIGGVDIFQNGWKTSIRLMKMYRQYSRQAGVCVSALEEFDRLFPFDGHNGSGGGGMNDMSWLECLPIDLKA